jgi:hypothetical protein
MTAALLRRLHLIAFRLTYSSLFANPRWLARTFVSFTFGLQGPTLPGACICQLIDH